MFLNEMEEGKIFVLLGRPVVGSLCAEVEATKKLTPRRHRTAKASGDRPSSDGTFRIVGSGACLPRSRLWSSCRQSSK